MATPRLLTLGIQDAELEFANATDDTDNLAVATATPETQLQWIDAGNMQIGSGKQLYMFIHIVTAPVGGGASLQFKLQSTATLPTPPTAFTTPTTHIDTGAIAITALTIGTILTYPLPTTDLYLPYVGVLTTASGANTTAGAMNCGIVCDAGVWTPYPSGLSFL